MCRGEGQRKDMIDGNIIIAVHALDSRFYNVTVISWYWLITTIKKDNSYY